MFELRIPVSEIPHWSSRYQYRLDDQALVAEVPRVRETGRIDRELLHRIALWKAPRSARHILKNEESFVQEITSIAMASIGERTRVEVLTLLHGVWWPTASVILHFFHRDSYPILDYRALWSVTCDAVPQQYCFDLWASYVSFFRATCKRANCDSRTVDRALWQYSKEHQ